MNPLITPLPQLPIEVWEQSIDWIATQYSAQKDLLSCVLVCQAWRDRARLHLYGNIELGISRLSQFLSTIRNSPGFPFSFIKTMVIDRRGSKGGTLSALFILNRMKNLTHLRLHHASFKENSLLSRALLLRSVQHLDLQSMVDCTVACLILITKACPLLVTLGFHSYLNDPGQILPPPCPVHNRSLICLNLNLSSGSDRFIQWYILEGSFLASLRELHLSWFPHASNSRAYSDSMRPLLCHCRRTLETLRIDFNEPLLEQDLNPCMFYIRIRSIMFSCSYS